MSHCCIVLFTLDIFTARYANIALFWFMYSYYIFYVSCFYPSHLDCEQSLFSQSSLRSAGLERANWPRGKLERGGKKRKVKDLCGFNIQLPAIPSCSTPLFSQIAAGFEAIEMKRIFTLMYIKLIFTGKVSHLASF